MKHFFMKLKKGWIFIMFTDNTGEVLQAENNFGKQGRVGKRWENPIWKKAIEDILDPTSDMTDEERSAYLNRIMAKLKSGKDLTQEELNFLKVHHPELYQKAMRVKHCKERLKSQLKNCRSKEQVNDVVNSTVGGVSDKDPDKEFLIAAYNEVVKEFKKTSDYSRLPDTEKERIENEKKKKGKKNNNNDLFSHDDNSDSESDIMPIQELLDVLPVFDANA